MAREMDLKSAAITDRLGSILLVLFGLLWAIWIQPHTIAARNIFLIAGSVLGIYVIFISQSQLRKVSLGNPGLWALICIGLLLVWVVFHYFFLSRNPQLQWEELTGIWKRIIISIPFAFAVGISFAARAYEYSHGARKSIWPMIILVLSLSVPTLLFLVRYSLTHHLIWIGWPEAFRLIYPPSSWYIPKTGYVFFCLPVLALAVADLLRIGKLYANSHKYILIRVVFDILAILSVLSVFYLENIKNGMIYSLALIVAGFLFWSSKLVLSLVRPSEKNLSKRSGYYSIALVLFMAIMFFVITKNHIEKNESWKSLVADTKIALQTEKYDHWKYLGQKGYPENEFGKTVSITNYERAAWAKIALTFVDDYPFGYGLVLESFRHIAKEMYPESSLLQSHSAWLDLLLGLGIPGACLIAVSGTFALLGLRSRKANNSHVNAYMTWFLASMLLCMLTTEVAQKVYLDALIFCIIVSASYCIMNQALEFSNINELNREP